MKNIFIALLAITLFSCTKQVQQKQVNSIEPKFEVLRYQRFWQVAQGYSAIVSIAWQIDTTDVQTLEIANNLVFGRFASFTINNPKPIDTLNKIDMQSCETCSIAYYFTYVYRNGDIKHVGEIRVK